VSKKRVFGMTLVAGIALATLASPAQAMGTGQPYDDMQVGVTYTVYEPTFVAGLKAQHIGGRSNCPQGTEENLSASYGTRTTKQFTISEGNPMCWDIGVGAAVMTTTIMGAKATVYAYCDPASSKPCTKADVKKFGGHLAVVLPAKAGLRPTTVWIETFGRANLSAAELVKIAKGLVPAV
jgi:hypothetical protein